ncbi:hypothetical protein [Desulfotalea psychrophila]|uniref:Uncharacterized protein n=1 Tax=Desulfotalea psychrophila (strain LSv54 / DSM 12343) TaxID=177439 RepID=Q6AKK6_DESPS|nr:hypothetical protein [Desulfotalea psychrophila]CAG37119.1 unknown protein [Desulfotalea psychrophila LSv54]
MDKIDLPDLPFVSDGCSGGLSWGWVKIFRRLSPLEECCYNHDIEYHFGSGRRAGRWESFIDRLWVDNQFALCVFRSGWCGKVLVLPIWLAVRLGGGGYLYTSYRWGFGWNWKG